MKQKHQVILTEVFLIETKGLEDLDTPLKMARLKQWREDLIVCGKKWYLIISLSRRKALINISRRLLRVCWKTLKNIGMDE